MKSRGALVALMGILAALMPRAATAMGPIRFPCPGETATDRVNLRAGRSLNYEVCGTLDAGRKVTVTGYAGGWFRVVPPEGTRVWVFSQYLAGKKVAAGRLNIRATPSLHGSVLCQLERGERVEVVETKDEWTAIRPPACASLWVSAELVDLLPDEQGEEAPAGAASGDELDLEEEEAAAATGPVNVVHEQPPATAAVTVAPRGPVAVRRVPRVYEGTLERCGEIVVPGASHRLVSGFLWSTPVALLGSQSINFSFYEGDRVRVWGYQTARLSDGTPVVDVLRLEVR
ncbi:MAG: SH3 domain-containing protein [Candidatus Aureabacteria bacterium]|nr:SH3 domain-containing protein [Candidatus Auribacterota bacterium]